MTAAEEAWFHSLAQLGMRRLFARSSHSLCIDLALDALEISAGQGPWTSIDGLEIAVAESALGCSDRLNFGLEHFSTSVAVPR